MYYNTFMIKIKEPFIAGTFYPREKEELQKLIDSFKENNKNYYKNSTRAVIVPHAGLIFSGRLAYEGINQLDKNIKNLFIFAPAHKVAFEGLALTSYNKWKTPLGNISINKTIGKDLEKSFGAKVNDEALEEEHSIEVQVPIIQDVLQNAKIIPVLIGRADFKQIKEIIEKYYDDEENGFIISSDLSHYLNDEAARKLDVSTAQMIETGNLFGLKFEQACGALGVAGLVEFANQKGFSLIRIDITNSSTTTGDKSRVVGYGSWFLYEGERNQFIKDNHSKFITDLVKLIIKSQFKKERITLHYPQVFDEYSASFVTLEMDGHLRGCIGSIIAHQPLINDIIQHAGNAAFRDGRFRPVSEDEVDKLKVSVSILSNPTRIKFKDEDDLLEQIIPEKDGIIIRDGQYQAVFLPSVWKELPDKKDFLNSLKIKAGLSADYFSYSFEAFRFETVYIEE